MSATSDLPTVTRTITEVVAELVPDEDPDLSWLDQSDAEMGEGFEAEARERKEAFNRGDWWMVGVVVSAMDETGHKLAETSLWCVESDSGSDYFRTIASNLTQELGDELGVSLLAVPVTYTHDAFRG